MKNRIISIFRLSLVLMLLLITVMAAGPKIGSRAPDFSMINGEGKATKLGDLLGKQKTVLVFFRTLH